MPESIPAKAQRLGGSNTTTTVVAANITIYSYQKQ